MKIYSNIYPQIEVKQTFVRIPSNIVQIKRTFDGVEEIIYEYDEEVVSNEEYVKRLSCKMDNSELLEATMLLDNANQQVKINECEIANANLLLEIAMMKGGM